MNFPSTSLSLLSKLKHPEDGPMWHASWKRFLELYHEPITVVALSCYRHHTGGQAPAPGFIEDAVANVIAEETTGFSRINLRPVRSPPSAGPARRDHPDRERDRRARRHRYRRGPAAAWRASDGLVHRRPW